MKEYLLSKAHVFAYVNVAGTLASVVLIRPLSFAAGVLAVLAGIINLSIQWHNWRNLKEGWGYKFFSWLFKWKK